MATLAPLDVTGTPSLYRLSIIIFRGRTVPRLPAIPPERYMERLIPSVDVASGGAGGDVTLRVLNDRYEDLVDIDAGQWLMLMTTTPAPPPGGDPLPLFRWYRILHADSEPIVDTVTGGATPPWLLDVTLDGADWPTGLPTQAVFVPNIVHVRERTVRLSVN